MDHQQASSDSFYYDRKMYDKVVTVVLAMRRASISLVQRHLLIGYNRAARIMEAMESQGVVSAIQPNGVRTILTPHRATDATS